MDALREMIDLLVLVELFYLICVDISSPEDVPHISILQQFKAAVL